MSKGTENYVYSVADFSVKKTKEMAVQLSTDTVKNAKMTTESVVNFVCFETLTTEKSATVRVTVFMVQKGNCLH